MSHLNMTQNFRRWVLFISMGLIFLGFGLIGVVFLHDLFKGQTIQLGPFDWSFILIGHLIIVISYLNYTFAKKRAHSLQISKIHYVSAFTIVLLGASLIYIWKINKNYKIHFDAWSIGISVQDDVLQASILQAQYHQILKASDVTDVTALFVADPILFEQNGIYYLFFEVLNARTQQGDIGVATSTNGLDWHYERIVLDEKFHLSYPYVFEWNGSIYMVPESAEDESVRLYKATQFPYEWQLEKKMIQDTALVDPTLFEHDGHWWLFAGNKNNDALYLYYADQTLTNWTLHPKNPIVQSNKKYARPAGNVIQTKEHLVRLAQDDAEYYGQQTWAFQINQLTLTNYEEQLLYEKPILKGNMHWNQKGMHTFSSLRMPNGRWLVAVDGF